MNVTRKLLLCFLLALCLPLTAFAAGASVSLEPSTQTVSPGDTFSITATLDNQDLINLCTVALAYDETVFEMVDGTCHVENVSIGQVVPAQKAGTFFQTVPSRVSGKVFTFQFKAKENAPLGQYPFTVQAATGTLSGEKINATGTSITLACNHSFGTWAKANEDRHSRSCSACSTLETALHTWDEGVVTEAATDRISGVRTYTCLVCAATKAVAIPQLDGHRYDDDCDKDCNTCGQVREPPHQYGLNWAKDETHHCHLCPLCGQRKDITAHDFGEDAVCTVCGYAASSPETEPSEGDIKDPISADIIDDGFPWWILVVALAVIGAGVTLVLLIKRKR